MKKATLLLLTLLALIGYTSARAGETVNNYAVDFNQVIKTSDHQFAVAKDWKHIADYYDDDGDFRYMSYSYSSTTGVGESGALLAYRQYASGGSYGSDGKVVYDMLVTPKVSGKVTIQVKGSISATTSNPSYIEFYQVNEKGTEYGEKITAQLLDADQHEAEINLNGYVTAQIELSAATRIGIRAQYVYLDNFTAESAVIEKERKLAITSAVPSATTGTIYWDQLENGNVLVKYMVKVTNLGDVSLTQGEDDYTISIFNRKTNVVYVTAAIPQALAPQETSDEFEVSVELAPTIWPNSYTYFNMDLKENVSGSVVQRAQSAYTPYVPKFVFREGGSTSTSSLYGDIAFGMVTEEVSKTYEIYNDGIAPLQVKSITVPEGFTVNLSGEFTVAPKAFKSFTITLPATTQGVFSGNVVVVYVDKDGAEATYSKAVTGTVLDPSKNLITFDDGAGNSAYPAGSVRGNVYISTEGSGAAKNYYLQDASGNPLFITPLMTATAGEKITFDAKYTAYSGSKVEVMISKDRQNWTTIQTISNISSESKWTTYTAEIPEAGDWYLGFKLTKAKIDNIYGLVYAEGHAHNLFLIKSDIPAKGTQNTDYTATISVSNIGPNMEVAGNYTATLYVDGEAVATNNKVNMPVADISGNYNNFDEKNYATLSFTFKPHTVGLLPAYIEVASGDALIATEIVNIEIVKEELLAEAGTTVKGYSINTPLNLNYCNSESVSLYTGEMLGLKKGDKISSITWKGYCTSDKEVETNLSIFYEWTGDAKQPEVAAELYNTSGMKAVIENQLTSWEKKGDYGKEEDFIVVNFPEPLVYDGISNLRLVVRSINPEGKTTQNYKSVTFEKADVTGIWCYTYWNDNDRTLTGNRYAKDLPAIHLALDVEPITLSGVVTDNVTNEPIEGATVTIRNEAEDIEYTATTNADGQYNIDVIQKTLTYTATITAYGYEDLVVSTHEFDFSEGSIQESFALTPIVMTIPVTITNSTFATLYYESKILKAPENVTVYTASLKESETTAGGMELVLNEVSDKIIPAGLAVMIKGDAGTYDFEVLDHTESDNVYLSELTGTETGGTFTSETDYFYVLSWKNAQKNIDEVGFYWQQGTRGVSATLKAHQAYLRLSTATSAGISLSFGEETGINMVERAAITDAGAIYNLSGMRINANQLRKGIYVVNGKKVVIK